MQIRGAKYIEMGDKLLNVARNSRKYAQTEPDTIKRIKLTNDELQKLTKNDDGLKQDYLFGRQIDSLYNWSLDIAHKIKSNYEILYMTLKKDGEEVLKGAISKSKKKKKEFVKIHFTNDDMYLKTGYARWGKRMEKADARDVLPNKFLGYLWRFSDRDLQIMSEYFGLNARSKSIDEISKEWKISPRTVKAIKNQIMWRINGIIPNDLGKSIEKTEPSHYTVLDYIEAIGQIKGNRAYKRLIDIENAKNSGFSTEMESFDEMIDDKFLEELKVARKAKKVIDEWRQTISGGGKY